MGGKRLQNVEDASEIIVGKFYLVPTVCVDPHFPPLQCVPIVGPLHEDSEIINFPARHFHPDRRFVSESWLAYYGDGHHWGAVYSFEYNGRKTGMFETGRKRMKCRRLVDWFSRTAPWLQKLEKAYAGETLRDGHICPHRGISCRGVSVDDKGCVVCPGHGLQFNLASGNLVSRVGQPLQPRLIK